MRAYERRPNPAPFLPTDLRANERSGASIRWTCITLKIVVLLEKLKVKRVGFDVCLFIVLLGEEEVVISVTLLEFVMPSVEVDVEYHDGTIRQTGEKKPAESVSIKYTVRVSFNFSVKFSQISYYREKLLKRHFPDVFTHF